MSFRPISALPTCLHARLAFRRQTQFRGFATCSRCQYTYAQALPTEGSSHAAHSLETARRGYFRSSGAQRVHRSHQDRAFKPGSTPSMRPDARPLQKQSTPASRPRSRIGSVLEVPDFIFDTLETDVPERSQHEAPHGSTARRTNRKFTERYKEWEILHDKFLEVRRTCPHQTADIFREQRELARRFLGDITFPEVSSLELRCKWLALHESDQRNLLPKLLIGSLAESPEMSLFLLQRIGHIPSSFLIRMNCLRAIGIMYWKQLQLNSDLKSIYEEQIERLRSPDLWPSKKLPAVLLQNLLYWSNPDQCSTIMKNFSERYPDADETSTVAFIDHYIRIGDQEQALEHLRRLPESLLREPNNTVKGLRDGLLKLDVVAKGENGTNFKYLPQLLALGIPPDEALHNTVIQSAILNGLPDVAWDLYQYLENSQFQSNARSHLVLLRDAFQREDLHRVNEIMTAIHNREDLISDQYLMAYSMNIVRNISYFEKELGPSEACAHVMALYDRAYNRAALVRLGVVTPLTNKPDLPDPSPTLLAFTMWTYVLVQQRTGVVIRLWQWFQHLVAQEDRAVLDAAKFDIVYNGLILFYARKAATLSRALEVVQYMLTSRMCLPTPRTWSILLCAFLRHGQVAQAEKTLALMQSKGFRVQEITERYSRYVPVGYDLQLLAGKVDQDLDERDMPQGIEELLAKSNSLQQRSEAGSI